MATKVFISYRRDDSAGHAGRVQDRLERELGRDLLFMDVDAVPLGDNFVTVLSEEVAKCDVLLAVIGPNWLNARDEDGSRRLDNPHDFVRIEIGAALQRSIPSSSRSCWMAPRCPRRGPSCRRAGRPQRPQQGVGQAGRGREDEMSFHPPSALRPAPHSITSSARMSSVGGTSRPSAFAVLALMTNSNLVGT